MATNVDDATDPVSKAVALNIVTGHVAPGTLKKEELPECSVDTLQYRGKYKFPYDLLNIRRNNNVEYDKENITTHAVALNNDLEQGSEDDISSESSLLRASTDTEPGLQQQVHGGDLTNVPDSQGHSCAPQGHDVSNDNCVHTGGRRSRS